MTTPKPTKLQRWLDLIAYLVGRRLPVPVDELMERIPAYAAKWMAGDDRSRDTARRTFERDKEELRAAGIPLRTVRYTTSFGLDEIDGYAIDRRDFYLPYMKLVGGGEPRAASSSYADPARVAEFEVGSDEHGRAIDAARLAASLPSFPLVREARSAFRKLAFDLEDAPSDDDVPVLFAEGADVAALRARLATLSDALLQRKRVTFRYHGLYRGETTERDVAPYGLLFHGGHWYLVAHDAARADVRVFRVGRMDDVARNTRVPATADYAIPADFRLADYVGRRAWELGGDDDAAIVARVRFAFPLSLWAERNGYGTLVDSHADGSSVRRFEVRQVEPFIRWVLGCAGEARIVEPAALDDALRALATRIADAHTSQEGKERS
jgi:proteasome accessory factor B